MPRDWLADPTDVSDPFILKRDVLESLEDDIGSGGSFNRTIYFSQAGGAPSTATASPPVPAPFDGAVTKIKLATSSSPVGSPLTIQFLDNGVVFATLQIPDGGTGLVSYAGGDLPTVHEDDLLTVNATQVGASVAVQGLVAVMEMSA